MTRNKAHILTQLSFRTLTLLNTGNVASRDCRSIITTTRILISYSHPPKMDFVMATLMVTHHRLYSPYKTDRKIQAIDRDLCLSSRDPSQLLANSTGSPNLFRAFDQYIDPRTRSAKDMPSRNPLPASTYKNHPCIRSNSILGETISLPGQLTTIRSRLRDQSEKAHCW
jgi:hypothetical protein